MLNSYIYSLKSGIKDDIEEIWKYAVFVVSTLISKFSVKKFEYKL